MNTESILSKCDDEQLLGLLARPHRTILKTVVQDDDDSAVHFVGIIVRKREVEYVLCDTYEALRNVVKGAGDVPPLSNLYTLHINSSFRLDLPDPGDHRPWYHLDWSSPMSLRLNQHKLTRSQRWYLREINARVKAFPESFGLTSTAEDDYRTVANMIAVACARTDSHDGDASADLSFKDRFCRCRRIKFKTPRGEMRADGICAQRRFCPFCNYRLRQKALLTYVPAFDEGRWFSMTISSTTDLDLDIDELTFSWDAGKAVVRALIQAGHFQGAYWTEELHLESLAPEIRVLPHCHVLFHAVVEVDEEAVHTLAEQTFREYFDGLLQAELEWEQTDTLTPLEPSIELEELRTRADLYKWCDYLTKTVRVVDAYRNALDAVGDEGRWWVNTQFEQFLSGMMLMQEEDSPPKKKKKLRKKVKAKQKKKTAGKKPKEPRIPSRKQRHSLGTLRCGRSRRFVGVRPDDRPAHWSDLETLRQEIIAQKEVTSEIERVG